MKSIKVQCPAKINLELKVVGKRPDGFHNIESVMQTINLYDYLTIEIKPANKTEIILSGNSDEIPYDKSNLVYKAAKLFLDSLTTNENPCHSESHDCTKILRLQPQNDEYCHLEH